MQIDQMAFSYNYKVWVIRGVVLLVSLQPSYLNAREKTPFYVDSSARQDSTTGIQPNQSFLSNYHYGDDEHLPKQIMGDKLATELSLEYDDITRNHNERKKYQPHDPIAERQQEERLKSFSDYATRRVMDYQINQGFVRAGRNSEEGRSLKVVHDQVKQVARGTMTTKLDEKERVKVGTRSNLPSRQVSLWITSPVVDGSFDVDYGSPNAFEASKRTQTSVAERYKASATRKLPGGVRGSVAYGIESADLVTALSRDIVKNVNCELSSTKPTDPTRSRLSHRGEEAVKLNYGLRF